MSFLSKRVPNWTALSVPMTQRCMLPSVDPFSELNLTVNFVGHKSSFIHHWPRSGVTSFSLSLRLLLRLNWMALSSVWRLVTLPSMP